MRIYDISLSLNNQTEIYPGNPEISIEPHRSVPEHPTNLSKITFGSHTGTHVDAPRHVDNDAIGVDRINLESCIGLCRVLDMTGLDGGVKISDLEKYNIKQGERILVKTKNSYLDGDAADYLANIGIVLFGIDSLSIKKQGSPASASAALRAGGPDTRPHTSLLKKDIVIFEGLDLSNIKPGEYKFIGLPLKFTDLDGAPARAVLISE